MGRPLAMLLPCILLAACGDDSSPGAPDGGGPDVPDGGGGPGTPDGGTPDPDAGGTPSTCTDSPWFVPADFTPVRRIYLSPTGDDGRDGLTAATAWRSLTNAGQLQPGDQVDVAAGTYPCGVSLTVHASAEHPVWIRAADGAGTATFDCAGGSGWEIVNAKYVVLDGLEIANSSAHGVHVQSGSTYTDLADHVLLWRLHVHHHDLACVKVNQALDVDIFDGEYDHPGAHGDNASAQAIDYVAVHGARIERNFVHDVVDNVAIQNKGGAQRTLVVGNRIRDAATAVNLGGGTGPQFFLPPDADYEAEGTIAVSNVIWGDTRVGLAAVGCHDCLIAGNTVAITAAAQPFRALPGAAGASAAVTTSHTINLRLIDNVGWFDVAKPQDLINAGADDTVGLTQSRNLYFYTGGAIASIWSDVPVGADSIVDQDPLLVAPAAGNLHLQAGSPAAGAGVAVPELTVDADGACRAAVPNIGAY